MSISSCCTFGERCCVHELDGLHHWLDLICSRECVDPEEWDGVYTSIVCVLGCLMHNNPDELLRRRVRIELMHPEYDEARRRYGANLDQPDRRAQR